MPQTLAEYDAWIREKPDYYTAVVFKGRGRFERAESQTLEGIRLAAKNLVSRSTRPAGIYAVRENQQSHIENVTGG